MGKESKYIKGNEPDGWIIGRCKIFVWIEKDKVFKRHRIRETIPDGWTITTKSKYIRDKLVKNEGYQYEN